MCQCLHATLAAFFAAISILAQDAKQPTARKKYSIVKLCKNTTAETEQTEHHQ